MFFLAVPFKKKYTNKTRGKNRNKNMGELNTITIIRRSPKREKLNFAIGSLQN